MIRPQTIQEGVEPSPFTFGTPPAQSCVVDNFTASYIYVQDAGVYVPPFSTRTVALPSPQSTMTVLWQTPPGIAVPVPSNGTAVIIWSDVPAQTTQASFYPSTATPHTIVDNIVAGTLTSIANPVNDGGVANLLWTTFSRLTATTTIAGALFGRTYVIWGWHVSIRPPVAGVNDGSVSLVGHTSGAVIDIVEYNQDSAAALGSYDTGQISFHGGRALAASEALDLVIFTDAGSLSVSGSVELQRV